MNTGLGTSTVVVVMTYKNTYLEWVFVKVGGDVSHDVFCNEHALWSSEATESCVGHQVSLAQRTVDNNVGKVVCVATVHHSTLHHLNTYIQLCIQEEYT